MKDRTKQELSDPTLGRLPNDAELLGIDSTQCCGNRSAAEIASRRLPAGWAKRRQSLMPVGVGGVTGAILSPPPDSLWFYGVAGKSVTVR